MELNKGIDMRSARAVYLIRKHRYRHYEVLVAIFIHVI